MNPEFDIPADLHARLNVYLKENLKGPELAAFCFLNWQLDTAFANIELLKDPTRNSPEYNRALDGVARSLKLLRAVCQDLGV